MLTKRELNIKESIENIEQMLKQTIEKGVK